MIFKHGAVVVGRFGGVLDFAVGIWQGEQRGRAGKKNKQGWQILDSHVSAKSVRADSRRLSRGCTSTQCLVGWRGKLIVLGRRLSQPD
jgi:hypothetical protein